ncbi:MAG TPA: tRNA (adenosine(37)-N6)-threonylcarbamoyltransferase complex transferase subunit TsaD [Candidatus Paceibacterota bacterium]|jgi:N6-L-threonylcarbamoyladenine synthase|nr:tRNA (adenosine(37)-N6)-threonylcarbamoyltransferase complex transferase subunit TsaD [Candidatus Paceibacterota bacterium]
MKILAIETSCDETAISLIEVKKSKNKHNFKILGNNVSSQIDLHKEFGGVFPALAKREHIKNLPIVFEKVLRQAKLRIEKIDAITVTIGPGLEPALWTGIVFAKELHEKYKIPIIPVNHMEGHIFSIFPKKGKTFSIDLNKKMFPILSLLISGGHTELVLVKNWGKYKKIGQTRDDAAGEAFDKVARMLGLPYPGGPEISRLANIERGNLIPLPLNKGEAGRGSLNSIHPSSILPLVRGGGTQIQLPRPMIHSKDYDFSFSGLKTAVLYMIRDIGNLTEEIKKKIAKEFEDAVVEVLVYKTIKAIKEYKIKTLIVGGGVSANSYLQEKMLLKIKEDKIKTKVHFPSKDLTGDNALMIAIAGYFQFINSAGRFKNKKSINKLKAIGNLSL